MIDPWFLQAWFMPTLRQLGIIVGDQIERAELLELARQAARRSQWWKVAAILRCMPAKTSPIPSFHRADETPHLEFVPWHLLTYLMHYVQLDELERDPSNLYVFPQDVARVLMPATETERLDAMRWVVSRRVQSDVAPLFLGVASWAVYDGIHSLFMRSEFDKWLIGKTSVRDAFRDLPESMFIPFRHPNIASKTSEQLYLTSSIILAGWNEFDLTEADLTWVKRSILGTTWDQERATALKLAILPPAYREVAMAYADWIEPYVPFAISRSVMAELYDAIAEVNLAHGENYAYTLRFHSHAGETLIPYDEDETEHFGLHFATIMRELTYAALLGWEGYPEDRRWARDSIAWVPYPFIEGRDYPVAMITRDVDTQYHRMDGYIPTRPATGQRTLTIHVGSVEFAVVDALVNIVDPDNMRRAIGMTLDSGDFQPLYSHQFKLKEPDCSFRFMCDGVALPNQCDQIRTQP